MRAPARVTLTWPNATPERLFLHPMSSVCLRFLSREGFGHSLFPSWTKLSSFVQKLLLVQRTNTLFCHDMNHHFQNSTFDSKVDRRRKGTAAPFLFSSRDNNNGKKHHRRWVDGLAKKHTHTHHCVTLPCDPGAGGLTYNVR